MNLLITAGNTQTPIDRVRCITNVFSGRTGGRIATVAAQRGHSVTLLTSHPEVVESAAGLVVRSYRSFEDLDRLMTEEVTRNGYQAVIHAAAVGDYHVAGVFAQSPTGLVDAAAGKVKSSHAELWLKLTPTPKLVDKVRRVWHFTGVLVKFKLEVGASEADLLAVAERSRIDSEADLMCANTLEGMHEWVLIGAGDQYRKVSRETLASTLITAVEAMAARS